MKQRFFALCVRCRTRLICTILAAALLCGGCAYLAARERTLLWYAAENTLCVDAASMGEQALLACARALNTPEFDKMLSDAYIAKYTVKSIPNYKLFVTPVYAGSLLDLRVEAKGPDWALRIARLAEGLAAERLSDALGTEVSISVLEKALVDRTPINARKPAEEGLLCALCALLSAALFDALLLAVFARREREEELQQ